MKTKMTMVFESDSGIELKNMYAAYRGLDLGKLEEQELKDFLDDFFSKYTAGESDFSDDEPSDAEDNELRVEVDNLDDLRKLLVAFEGVRQSMSISQNVDGVQVDYSVYNGEKLKHHEPDWNAFWNANLMVSVDLAKAGLELQSRIDKAINVLKGGKQ